MAGDPVVGFAHVLHLDGEAHLEQIAVHPNSMGQGIGSALLEAACVAAEEAGFAEISLTTFADVPWNAPFYAARGFAIVEDLKSHHQELRANEQAMGLDRHGPRVVMSRSLGAPAPPLAATS